MDRRRNAAERLLASYSRFYGITRFDGMDAPETEGVREALKLSVPLLPGGAELTAVCEYYERDGGYFLLRSNELWTSEQEEFIFLFTCPRLTEAVHEAVKEFVCREGKKMAHIGPGQLPGPVEGKIPLQQGRAENAAGNDEGVGRTEGRSRVRPGFEGRSLH